MKNQAKNNGQRSILMSAGRDTFSRVLLIVAIILYSTALVLLANLAIAGESKDLSGALIKVNNRLNGEAFANTNATVRSVHGNVLAIDMRQTDLSKLNSVEGICASQLDRMGSGLSTLDTRVVKSKYSGAHVVVGVLDNSGVISASDMTNLMKMETAANIGFISYLSDDPTSTVIMRNLKGGESNLVEALAYMQEYAKTVNKPLVIEMVLSGKELENPLFVQVCQKIAEAGVQFLGAPGVNISYSSAQAPIQLAFSMFNTKTGMITDQSDFWAIGEVKMQEIMLLGSDDRTCEIFFLTESNFDKIYMSNSSDDVVMVTTLSADGEVNYYHVTNKETALIPRPLLNGTPVLEDGLTGIYPYFSKKALFNDGVAKNQFVALNRINRKIALHPDSGMALSIGSPSARTLAMSLSNLAGSMKIEIRDANGETVYKNRPDAETQSIQTKIDLSEGAEGLYFLDLTSPEFHQSFALLMD
ncbi:MAG: hypothetical protein K9J17_01590 [Flavobacteriales bacterium]|nr:hypothetical protein [Flavobacteriales bacterium]